MANITEKVWWIETESETSNEVNDPQLGLATYSRIDENVTFTHLDASKEIKIYGSVYDESFIPDNTGDGIGLEESPNIPQDFHDALTHFVIMKGYEMKPEAIQLAQYFENKWNMCINEGKEYSNSDMQGSTPSIISYDY
tara:strand:+ start:438 stop:854 length:417 start_codon:yes stop_codon:yes gene_type:complete